MFIVETRRFGESRGEAPALLGGHLLATMIKREDDSTPRERQFRRGAWAISIAVLGVLLFTWPFVRTPLLAIGPSYAHLLGAWAVIVLALAALSRALGGGRRARGDRG
jgi:hypothetical protein